MFWHHWYIFHPVPIFHLIFREAQSGWATLLCNLYSICVCVRVCMCVWVCVRVAFLFSVYTCVRALPRSQSEHCKDEVLPSCRGHIQWFLDGALGCPPDRRDQQQSLRAGPSSLRCHPQLCLSNRFTCTLSHKVQLNVIYSLKMFPNAKLIYVFLIFQPVAG